VNEKGLLIVVVAVGIAAYLASIAPPHPAGMPPTTTGGPEWSDSVGARNHSGIEPYDPFGFKRRGW